MPPLRPTAQSLKAPGPRRGRRTLFRCYSYLRPYALLAAGGMAGMLVADALNLANPQLIRLIVDRGIGRQDLRLVGLLVVALVGIAVARGIVTFLQGRWIETASQGVAFDMRGQIFDRLAALSFSWHDRSEAGQLLSRAVQDVDRVRFLTGRATFRLVDSIVFTAATLVALFAMNPRLALLGVATFPLLALVSLRFGTRQRALAREAQNQLAVLTARLEQGLRGIRIVRAFAQEEAEIERFERENGGFREISVAMARNQSVVAPLLILITSLGTAFTIWYGGRMVMSGGLTIGDLVAFSTYLGQLMAPVRLMGMLAPAIGQAVSSGERVFEILDAKSEVTEAPDAKPLGAAATDGQAAPLATDGFKGAAATDGQAAPLATDGFKGAAATDGQAAPRGRVEFQNVSFAYFNRYKVLEDVSFVAEPGHVVALLGATGSGKSTIVNLIPRFYDVTGGRILVDGCDVRELTLSSLRGTIGIVLQETTLFAASVRENILFGVGGGAGPELMERAARQAQAHDFIMAMPEGYETRIGERGATLSGGQKQRIAIARAIAKNPRILILDDATSSVDATTEGQIQTALDNLMADRTTFVIAHRVSTIRRADLILVLEGGRIVARGTHEDLLAMSPTYAEIFARQALGADGRS